MREELGFIIQQLREQHRNRSGSNGSAGIGSELELGGEQKYDINPARSNDGDYFSAEDESDIGK